MVYPGVKLLDLAGPLQVFTDATEGRDERAAYRTAVVSLDGSAVESDTVLPLASEPVSL